MKWAKTDPFNGCLSYAQYFTIYRGNNPLTYVFISAKLNTTALRWVVELADFNYKVKYFPGKSNADVLSRLPLDPLKIEDLLRRSKGMVLAVATAFDVL